MSLMLSTGYIHTSKLTSRNHNKLKFASKTQNRGFSTRPRQRHLRSTYFAPIVWDAPNDAVIDSHKLLIQAGFIKKLASGIYTYLPLGLRSISKITKIVDQEMESVGGQKINMPKLLPKDLWEKTGRWNEMGNELIRLKDRKNEDFCLAPTHEEIVTSLVASSISSSKQLPLRLYQIGDKYRDEARPRFGLLRAREFVMKDMYSFDCTQEEAIKTYNEVHGAYNRVMQRLELPYVVAEADSGNIGGNMSHEFHALASVGEDTLLCCPSGNYHANLEKAISVIEPKIDEALIPSQKLNHDDLVLHLASKDSTLSASLFIDTSKPDHPILVLSDKQHQCNPYFVKSVAHLGHDYTHKTLDLEAAKLWNSTPHQNRMVIIDNSLLPEAASNLKIQNKSTLAWLDHVKSTFESAANLRQGNIRTTKAGDLCACPNGGNPPPSCCGGTKTLEERKGIEVGHLFYLGTKYSSSLKANFMTTSGTQPIEMGCYGIGVSRLLAVAVETSNDQKGIKWPKSISPFKVMIISTKENLGKAEELYDSLTQLDTLNDEIMLDDRSDSIGYRLKESNLIGIPYNIVLGKKFNSDGQVEIESRSGEKLHMQVDQLKAFFEQQFAGL